MELGEEFDSITEKIIGRAMRVHSALGPGLLESAYETCMVHELTKAGLTVARQVTMPIRYDGFKLDAGYRLDLLVENKIVVELKTVERFEPIHTAQLLSYLKLGNYRLGLLLNFNVVHFRNGIRRVVYNPSSASSAPSAVKSL
ncbi:MAG: GxxExxY protein [Sulfurifustaceae bacterium]